MHSEVEQKAKREAALEQLKQNRRPQKHPHHAQASSSWHSESSSSSSSSLPPAQSRDGTVTSRFFVPSTPSTRETVLVPNSSPVAQSPSPYQPYRPGHGGDVASGVDALARVGLWSNVPRSSNNDLLTAPTTFYSNSNPPSSSLRRTREGGDDDAPPRKRLATSNSNGSLHEPQSPGVQRAGQRRRAVPSRDDESEDSLPEVSDIIPSRSRLVRANPATTSGSSDPFTDSAFTKFKMTMPIESIERVKAAWLEASGDNNKASALLANPRWTPKRPVSTTSQPTPNGHVVTPVKAVGRVDGYEEATKAQRDAQREKGKQSRIYTNFMKPSSQATPISKPPLTATVVETPMSQPIRRKRIKKIVDSESEASDSDDERQRKKRRGSEEDDDESRTLSFFNTKTAESIQELTGCTLEQASTILSLRPFSDVGDLNSKLGQGRKKVGPSGVSPRLFEEATAILQGYGTVDRVLEQCEETGADLRSTIASWTVPTPSAKGKEKDDLTTAANQDGSLNLTSLAPLKNQKSTDYLISQPSLLAEGIQLKDYQLIGVNWLRLLYNRRLSCILADEMGLGKTIQVISFFAYLKEKGRNGPHLIVVPSSTLENWVREFERFAPTINVKTYYGSKDDRAYLRHHLLESLPQKGSEEGWNVLVTTYNLAQGDGDRKFFRKIGWDSCVFDEGHVLKNFQSQRYQALLKVESKWRLLLTGTPLQNNLQELVSLMNFILPDQFSESMPELRAIFKAKGDSKVTLLAQERVSRAKKMMTPFVLRRRKDQVLTDLPKKTERLEWCDMTSLQKTIYRDTMKRSRKTVCTLDEEIKNTGTKARSKKPKTKDKQYAENTANVLMDLRKAASHPMLFRRLFTDDDLSGISKQLLKEPDFQQRGALFDLIKEDMTVMTDAELQLYCSTYKSTQKYLQDDDCYLNSGKVQTLLKLLDTYMEQDRKVLIFSQFTQILDILQAILKKKKVRYLILTGSTAVDVRQSLVDEFTEDDDIPVFLLSTKAGGMGINLTAASVVIMFDQDFNPHNDRQAQDRAYRIGQKRDVDVVKLITRGTIEEDMLKLGETKLALDEAVAGEEGDDAPEQEMKTSLMKSLRQQFEKEASEEPVTIE